MNDIVLSINEFSVSVQPAKYTCYGLGPCIGVFINARDTQISGAAHVAAIAERKECTPVSLVAELLGALKSKGVSPQSMEVKLVGGAMIYPSSVPTGNHNISCVTEALTRHGIFIQATDLGGQVARTARYNSLTGELLIRTSEGKTYLI